jgi:GH24 family phage-related lysozyme (muramidase)
MLMRNKIIKNPMSQVYIHRIFDNIACHERDIIMCHFRYFFQLYISVTFYEYGCKLAVLFHRLKNMLKLLQFLLCITLASSSCGPQETENNEGKKLCCYYDTKNIPTIGVGFNLQRADASTVMSTYNLVLANVLKDCQQKTNKSCLTDAQADDIFNRISYPEAAVCVDRYVPNLSTTKRAAIIDVAFAGCGTLNKFVKMKAALQKKIGNKLEMNYEHQHGVLK